MPAPMMARSSGRSAGKALLASRRGAAIVAAAPAVRRPPAGRGHRLPARRPSAKTRSSPGSKAVARLAVGQRFGGHQHHAVVRAVGLRQVDLQVAVDQAHAAEGVTPLQPVQPVGGVGVQRLAVAEQEVEAAVARDVGGQLGQPRRHAAQRGTAASPSTPRSCCSSQQKARSLSVWPTGTKGPSSRGWKPFRSPLWQKVQLRPHQSRRKGWQLTRPTGPCVALRMWATMRCARIGCRHRNRPAANRWHGRHRRRRGSRWLRGRPRPSRRHARPCARRARQSR